MEFAKYQEKAKETGQFNDDRRSVESSLWHLQEAINNVSKKYSEKGQDATFFSDENLNKYLSMELGDILWYVSNIASSHKLNLDSIAVENLQKCQKIWGGKRHELHYFDENFPEADILPRKSFYKIHQENGKTIISMPSQPNNWIQIGDRVTDNNYEDDGYRFHDVVHLGFMTFLGWSPVMRALLNRKRKSQSSVDEVEDGARAAVLEESISAMIFEIAREYNFFKNKNEVPFELLNMIDRITRNLEISILTYSHWDKAIIDTYKVFMQVIENQGGYIYSNMEKREMKFSKTPFDDIFSLSP